MIYSPDTNHTAVQGKKLPTWDEGGGLAVIFIKRPLERTMGTLPFRVETSGTAASLLRSSMMARIPATAGRGVCKDWDGVPWRLVPQHMPAASFRAPWGQSVKTKVHAITKEGS